MILGGNLLHTREKMSVDMRGLEVEVRSQTRKVRDLEERLSKLRWRKIQNVSALSSTLRSTRKMRENDIVSEMSGKKNDFGRNAWMKSVVEDELSRPLAVPEYTSLTKPNLLQLEKEQRNEYRRFDSHLRSVRKLARRMAQTHNSRTASSGKRSSRHLKRAGKEALAITPTAASIDKVKSNSSGIRRIRDIEFHLQRQKSRYDRSIRRIVKLQKLNPTWRTREPF